MFEHLYSPVEAGDFNFVSASWRSVFEPRFYFRSSVFYAQQHAVSVFPEQTNGYLLDS